MKSENDKIGIDDELIVRYLAGEAGPEEAEALHDWLTDATNRSYFQEIYAVWNGAHPIKTPRPIDPTGALEKLNKGMEAIESAERQRPRFLQRYRYAWRIAATLLLVTVVGIALYLKTRDKEIPMVSVTVNEFSRHVKFSDQSEVTLCRNTVLHYPATFSEQHRSVEMITGEAFFEVEHAPEPFIIHTSLANIRVVGTAFNVVLAQDKLEVSVKEGKVLVYTANDSTYLTAGFSGVVEASTKRISVMDTVNANTWGYATRRFVFNEASLAEVISSMEKAYPYTINLQNPDINNCRLTATFNNVSVEKMLNLIAETLNLSVARNDTLFTLQGEGCQ